MIRRLTGVVFIIILISGCSSMGRETGSALSPSDNVKDSAVLPGIMYVSPRSGLRMRDVPGLSGKVIMLLPFNAKVTVTERSADMQEIDGIRAPWAKADFSDGAKSASGWLFEGYLSEKEIPVVTPGWYWLVGCDSEYRNIPKYTLTNQYIQIRSNSTYELLANICEGFEYQTGKIEVRDGSVVLVREGGNNPERMVCRQVNAEKIQIIEHSVMFTCSQWGEVILRKDIKK